MNKIFCFAFLVIASMLSLAADVRQNPPQDLNWVTPYLIVKDVRKALDVYTNVFQFDIHQIVINPQNEAVFARIRYHGSNIILGPHDAFEGEKDFGFAPAEMGAASPIGIYVYCNDLEERYHKAQEANLKILIHPEKRFWGDTLFRVEDPDGYLWTFATSTHDFDPSLLPKELK